MLLFLPIMYAAVPLKLTYYVQYLLCSRTGIVVRLLCFLYAILHVQFTTCSRQFYKSVLLECINDWYNISKYTIILHHTMTVLLEYINHTLQ